MTPVRLEPAAHDGSDFPSTQQNPTALAGDTADSNYTSTSNTITVYVFRDRWELDNEPASIFSLLCFPQVMLQT